MHRHASPGRPAGLIESLLPSIAIPTVMRLTRKGGKLHAEESIINGIMARAQLWGYGT